jgi:polyferredoxin
MIAEAPPPSKRLRVPTGTTGALAAAAGAAALLCVVKLKAPYEMLLADRFLPGAGWGQIALMAVYAAWVASNLLDPKRQAVTRRRIWLLFSGVFYLQLLLGLAGAHRLLMTGVLHVPVPAVLVAGPIYRGEGLFMPILFLVTVLVVGPAWCSHLCYLGAWDALASRASKPPRRIIPYARLLQAGSLLAVAGTAGALRLLHAPGELATGLGIGFGAAGAGVMVLASRKSGRMVHCTTWCPVGLLATVLGRASPWRLRVAPSCTQCGRCVPACRYNALDAEHIRKGSPAMSCTLCMDCVSSCPDGSMTVSLYGRLSRNPRAAWMAFTVVLAVLQAVFLSVARV